MDSNDIEKLKKIVDDVLKNVQKSGEAIQTIVENEVNAIVKGYQSSIQEMLKYLQNTVDELEKTKKELENYKNDEKK